MISVREEEIHVRRSSSYVATIPSVAEGNLASSASMDFIAERIDSGVCNGLLAQVTRLSKVTD